MAQDMSAPGWHPGKDLVTPARSDAGGGFLLRLQAHLLTRKRDVRNATC